MKTYELTIKVATKADNMHTAEDIALSRLDDTGLTYTHKSTVEVMPKYKYLFELKRTGTIVVKADSLEEADEILMEADDELIDDRLDKTGWTLIRTDEEEG